MNDLNYNAQDLSSILFFMKNTYGIECFKSEYFYGLFCDCALDNLSQEKRIIKKLFYSKYIEKLALSIDLDSSKRKELLDEIDNYLTKKENIAQEESKNIINVFSKILYSHSQNKIYRSITGLLVIAVIVFLLFIGYGKLVNMRLDHAKNLLDQKKYEEAYRIIKPLSESNPSAQLYLGYMHKNGYGVKKDYIECIKYYKLSADKGCSLASFNLGNMYFNGDCVKQDYIEAFKYYKQAADSCNNTAIAKVGQMLLEGIGVEKNIGEALKYTKIAAE